MEEDCAKALRREFNYVPDEEGGERWVVYQDRRLIVIHPERRIRAYRRHGSGPNDYYEIEPTPCPPLPPPAIDSWDITGPDQEGRIWLNVSEDGSFTMIDLGTAQEVVEKLADACARIDPE